MANHKRPWDRPLAKVFQPRNMGRWDGEHPPTPPTPANDQGCIPPGRMRVFFALLDETAQLLPASKDVMFEGVEEGARGLLDNFFGSHELRELSLMLIMKIQFYGRYLDKSRDRLIAPEVLDDLEAAATRIRDLAMRIKGLVSGIRAGGHPESLGMLKLVVRRLEAFRRQMMQVAEMEAQINERGVLQ